MSKQLFSALITSTVLLTACGAGSGNSIEDAAAAMSETACLLFDESIAFEEIPKLTEEIVVNHGFDSALDIDVLIEEITGTEELNKLVVAVREALEENCGEELELNGLSPADLAESIVLE